MSILLCINYLKICFLKQENSEDSTIFSYCSHVYKMYR